MLQVFQKGDPVLVEPGGRSWGIGMEGEKVRLGLVMDIDS
jgi:hypothetical protein